jgi:hypothetical protein
MSPEQFIANIAGIVQACIGGLGLLSFAMGTAGSVAGRAFDNPGWSAWGRRGWFGAAIALASGVIYAIIQNIAQRAGGG